MDSYLASVAKDLILSVLANGEQRFVWSVFTIEKTVFLCVNETHASLVYFGDIAYLLFQATDSLAMRTFSRF